MRTPVTMPGTRVTVWPLSGETRVVPWMSWIRVVPGSVGSGSGVGSVVPPPGVCPAALTGVGAPHGEVGVVVVGVGQGRAAGDGGGVARAGRGAAALAYDRGAEADEVDHARVGRAVGGGDAGQRGGAVDQGDGAAGSAHRDGATGVGGRAGASCRRCRRTPTRGSGRRGRSPRSARSPATWRRRTANRAGTARCSPTGRTRPRRLFASSTKSLVSVAPELPPPPYTSATTAWLEGVAWAAGSPVRTTDAAIPVDMSASAAARLRCRLGLAIGTRVSPIGVQQPVDDGQRSADRLKLRA